MNMKDSKHLNLNLAAIVGRFFLFSALAAAAIAGGAFLSGCSDAGRANHARPPDLLLILSDQSRHAQHWPAGWEAANLPNEERLKANGLTFERFYCNASMCSPSRATLFTGLYPAEHGVERTLTYGGTVSGQESSLPLHLPNLARMLEDAGYNVVLKGKWHLSKHYDGTPPNAIDVAEYGFNEWSPTTAGEGAGVEDFGGGCADSDTTVIDEAMAFLEAQKHPGRVVPFCLIVSLANPHDVHAFPRTWDQKEPGCDNYASSADFNQGIELPSSDAADDLSAKPTAQAQSRQLYSVRLGALDQPSERLAYVNYYAYLHKLVDAQIGDLLDTLGELTENTIIIRTSDHGEMGLAHGGLRQKMFNIYEETLRVRCVISNPKLFPAPVTTAALASSIDLMPTIAGLAGVTAHGRGNDLAPVLSNPGAVVQDAVIFTFDDDQVGTGNGQTMVLQPNHIRCIRLDDEHGEWKYARYFDPSIDDPAPEQYEMYHLRDSTGADVDPDELDNLANPASPNYAAYAEHRTRLAARLAEAERQRIGVVSKNNFESGDTRTRRTRKRRR